MSLPTIGQEQFLTAKFKIHNPSGYKRRRLLRSIDLVSREYTRLLELLSQHEEEVTQAASRERVNKKTGEVTVVFDNAFGLARYLSMFLHEYEFQCKNALRDTLITDASGSILSYLNLKKKQDEAHFPSGKEDSSPERFAHLLDDVLALDSLAKEDELKAALKRKGKVYRRPISFARFRHCFLIRSKDGTKLWAVVNIPPGDKLTTFPTDCVSVRSDQPFPLSTSRTYMLLPLEVGRWHMHTFFRTGVPKTSKLYYDDEQDCFYLCYTFTFTVEATDVQSFMGIDRGRVLIGAYGVVDFENQVLEADYLKSERIKRRLHALDEEIRALQARGAERIPFGKWRAIVNQEIHGMANEIVEVASRHRSAIVFEDLTNMTKTRKRVKFAPRNPFHRSLKKSQYMNLKQLVTYKANKLGLPVIEVFPHYTSTTCPECGMRDMKSRPDQETFCCTECGHTANADVNAGIVIAMKGNWIYGHDSKKGGNATLSEFIHEYRQAAVPVGAH